MHPHYPRLATVICSLGICAVVICGLSIATENAIAQQLPASPTNGTFINSGQALAGETGNGVALGDLDGDGDIDAFVANDFSAPNEANHVWCNQGNGVFASGPIFGTTDGHAIALGDLDGDDDLDAVIAGDVPNQVWLNEGGICTAIAFDAGASLGAFTGYGVALGDVDNDTDLDVLLVGNSNQVWLNNGDATFVAGPTFPFLFSQAALLVDLDGDDFLDAFIADSGDGSDNQLWWNDGNWNPGPGSFTAGDVLPTANLIHGVGAGNLDADNRPDLFLVGSSRDQLYWNEGTRTFTTTGTLPVADNSYAIALADVDTDGDLDGVVANITGDPNRLWRNEGSRVFTVTQEFGDESGFYWGRGLGVADLNGDEVVDLFEVTTAEDRVWFNTTVPAFLPNEEDWQIQLLSSRGLTGVMPKLALDGSGSPHIIYISTYANGYDEAFQQYSYASTLYHTRWTGVDWHTTPVRIFADSFRGGGVSLAVDSNGQPHIAYVNELDNRPHYVFWDGTRWQDQVLPGAADGYAYQVSLALDADDIPHLTYTFNSFEPQGWQLMYSVWDGVGWQTEIVDGAFNRSPNSLVIDANGDPHVAYISCPSAAAECSSGSETLKYARKVGAAWQTELLDDKAYPYFALALDNQGRPQLAYRTFEEHSESFKYAHWNGSTWQYQVITADHNATGIALDVDSAGNPHIFYIETLLSEGSFFKHARWNGSDWQIETLDNSGNDDYTEHTTVAMALDGNDNLHAAYHEPQFGDLRYISWTPNWQTRTLPENGTVHAPALELREGPTGGSVTPFIAYYNQSGGQVKVASWESDWLVNPLAFVSSPVTSLSLGAGAINQHVSYYDADNQRLLYTYWDGSEWNPEVVDEVGDVGQYNSLVLVGEIPHIAYWDATTRRIKLAVPDAQLLLWHTHPNLVGPALDAESGMLSASVLPGADIGVAYYDAANGDLRLAVWDAETATWTDELIDGAAGDVGRLHSLQTDGTEGVPVVAYFDETASMIKLAYKMGAAWQIDEVAATDGDAVSSLSLELGLQSRTRARIAYATIDGKLNVALLRDALWRTESVVTSGVFTTSTIASARDSRVHLAYPTAAGGLQYAFRTATLDVDTTDAGPPPPSFFADGYYNPLDACQAILDLIAGDTATTSNQSPHSIEMVMPLPLPKDEPVADLAIFGAMTTLFAKTPEGQHYIDLYRQHGAEMGQLGLNDGELLMDAYGTLQNFLPGLEALVRGDGDEVVATQEMVNDVLAIWQRLAAAGSPGLAAAINGELAKYNNLQDFVGMSFDEWAEDIGVPPPPDMIYAPDIRR